MQRGCRTVPANKTGTVFLLSSPKQAKNEKKKKLENPLRVSGKKS